MVVWAGQPRSALPNTFNWYGENRSLKDDFFCEKTDLAQSTNSTISFWDTLKASDFAKAVIL